LCALLVDGEVYEGGYVGEDVEAVLEADLHVVFGSFGAHPEHVVDCVGVFEVEAVVVLLSVVSHLVTDVGNEVDVRDDSSRIGRWVDLHIHLQLIISCSSLLSLTQGSGTKC
jgi:hypothetical protein